MLAASGRVGRATSEVAGGGDKQEASGGTGLGVIDTWLGTRSKPSVTLSAGTAPSGPPGTRRRQLGLLWEALQLKRGPPMTAVTPSVSAVACHRTSNAEPFISSRAYGRRPATLEREWEMWNKLQSHRDGSGAGDRSPKRPRKYARRLVRMVFQAAVLAIYWYSPPEQSNTLPRPKQSNGGKIYHDF